MSLTINIGDLTPSEYNSIEGQKNVKLIFRSTAGQIRFLNSIPNSRR
ncbi:hypothetical protein [Methanococcoides methylutens]|nr:hypothetical protein [Methanococcoides methylutens]